MHPKQIRELMRNPHAQMRFQTTGRLPEIVRPEGPLISVLKSMTPRERLGVTGLTVDGRLGYSGSRIFGSAEQALKWCCPSETILSNTSWPAESWRLKTFALPLTVRTVLSCATGISDSVRGRYGFMESGSEGTP